MNIQLDEQEAADAVQALREEANTNRQAAADLSKSDATLAASFEAQAKRMDALADKIEAAGEE